MTNDDTKNLKDNQDVIDAELDESDTDEMAFDPSMLDPNMFAQVQEMMGKLEKADELERENADLRGKLARLAADFENYRRRTNQDVIDAQNAGVAKAAEELMPVYDDLMRALEMGQKDPSKILPGVQSVGATILRTFEKLGLTPTGQEGEIFDPAFHEALSAVPGNRDGEIVQVYQLGFRMGDKLVRPARVVVTKASN